ncbi:MAG: secondary thiamine-phosphate synthase enzyme YjbQ [Gammaproteobacteria bacterium]|jgi:secondary thiamine-phosphate synthase enzyme|nr:secondary thiamine-phosphate synthase enzyme YjbQ [Gammaproteobacteria bacterium]
MLRQQDREWLFPNNGRGLYEVTDEIALWLREAGLAHGLLTLFLPHTSASLLIQENADPDVQADILAYLERLVSDGDPRYRHRSEGPDDMSAHLRAALTQPSISIPVRNGALALGTWQGIFIFEHRHKAQQRRLMAHFMGTMGDL